MLKLLSLLQVKQMGGIHRVIETGSTALPLTHCVQCLTLCVPCDGAYFGC